MPRRASRDVADDGQRRRLGADPRQPGRSARLLPLDARLEGAVDRRRQVPVHALRRRTCTASRRAVDELLEEGLEASIERHERCCRGLPCRRARDGARALAAQRRDRRGLRDRDRGARGADGRAGAGALPRALRGDDLRRPGCRQPRPHRPHGHVDRAVALPGRRAGRARAGRSPTSAPTSRSAPASRPPWRRCRRRSPSRRSHDLRLAHARRVVRVDVRRLARPRRHRPADARARDLERRRVLSGQRVRARGGRIRSPACTRSPGGTRACPGTSRRSPSSSTIPSSSG